MGRLKKELKVGMIKDDPLKDYYAEQDSEQIIKYCPGPYCVSLGVRCNTCILNV